MGAMPASEPGPVAVIGPLKATRMLLDGSAVLVRRDEWERLTARLAMAEDLSHAVMELRKRACRRTLRGSAVYDCGGTRYMDAVMDAHNAILSERAALAAPREGAADYGETWPCSLCDAPVTGAWCNGCQAPICERHGTHGDGLHAPAEHGAGSRERAAASEGANDA